MKVNIVVRGGDAGWICGRFARELAERLPKHGIDVTVNGPKADLEYQQVVYGDPDTRPAVGMFTHDAVRPRRYALAYDGQIALNPVSLGYLKEGGAAYPTLIEMPVDHVYRPSKPLVFGVAGRTYSDGRKGEHLVAAMMKYGYDVVAWGSGWPCHIVGSDLKELPAFYRSIDYYVDTAWDEGGCVPALEASAMGVPVISHDLGVLLPTIRYERGSWESLESVLFRLTHPRTYDDWAREHATYFRAVMARLWEVAV